MKRFVEGEERRQGVLLPEFLDDYIAEDNPVRAIDVFVDELDLRGLGFAGVVPETTGRPAYHPATMLKIYVYGYINQIQSSRRLERETARNVEMMWLTGRLALLEQAFAEIFAERAVRPLCETATTGLGSSRCLGASKKGSK
jgi:transposase